MTAVVRRLDRLTWPDLTDRRDLLLVVPLGSTEQHGPHLPLATDTVIALASAERLAEQRADVVVGPALPVGASGEHQAFAGTLSIGTPALGEVLVELGRSATVTFDRVLFVNGHGGNLDAVTAAVGRLRGESRDVRAWSPRLAGGDAHAGHVETSLLLALRPELVRRDRAATGQTAPLDSLVERLRSGGVAAVSPNGVLGDPLDADVAAGEALLDRLTGVLVADVAAWWP